MRFIYEEHYQQPIRRLELVGDLGAGQIELREMTRTETGWFLDVDLPPGQYCYKFLADRELYLQDSRANSYIMDQRGECWSVIEIEADGRQRTPEAAEPAKVHEYHICESLEDIRLVDKRDYLLGRNQRVAVRLLTESVSEIHPVQAVWIQPDGQIAQVTTGRLPLDGNHQMVYSWFYLPLTEESMPGRWRMLLYIDGHLRQEDSFLLQDAGVGQMQTYQMMYHR